MIQRLFRNYNKASRSSAASVIGGKQLWPTQSQAAVRLRSMLIFVACSARDGCAPILISTRRGSMILFAVATRAPSLSLIINFIGFCAKLEA